MARLGAGERRALDDLAAAGISLTLVDVGASLEPFRAFRPLLGRATYVGFDPDRRELHTEDSEAGRDDYLRLWACAAFSGNNPYALDVLTECRGRHGADELVDGLLALSVRRNRADARRGSWRLAEKVSVRNLKRFATKPY